MSALVWPVVGALTGLHAATWGAFKDCGFEGFRASSFARSVCLGLLVSVPVGLLTGADARGQVLVLIGLCYASERLVTEWWKTFLREDPQDGYAIPMRLAVGGRPVENRAARYGLGLAIAAGLGLVCVTGPGLQERLPGMPTGLLLVVGSVGGWLTALGGAWKDAPIEGFQRWKFLRSPVVATAWAVVLVPFTENLVLLAVAAGGASVATIETYKTFLAGGPPGKFAAKPVLHTCGGVRRACRNLHAGLYAVLACVLAVDLLSSTSPVPAGLSRSTGTASLLAVAMLSTALGSLVVAGARSASVETEQGDRSDDRSKGRVSHADLRRTVS
jgi:hypothetical protein